MRWLTLLEGAGLVERLHVRGEMNRATVTLSDQAFDQMTFLLLRDA